MEVTVELLIPILNNLVILVAGLILLRSTIFIVREQTRVIIERLGKFRRVAAPGIRMKIPLIDRKVLVVDLRMKQHVVVVDTMTKDQVFVKVPVAVQYRVMPAHAELPYYQLGDEKPQITSFVLDAVRAEIPTLELNDVFVKKDHVAQAVKTYLDETLAKFGLVIDNALVTDVEPASSVREAMNEIQTQQRLQLAAQAKGDADKVLMTKRAEGEAVTKRLQGEGTAAQRSAIIDGLKKSIEDMAAATTTDPREVMRLVTLTQYFDVMREIGTSAHSKVILMPHGPGAVADAERQLRDAMVIGQEIGAPSPV